MGQLTFSAPDLEKGGRSVATQSMDVSHFKVSEHTSEEAWKGLSPSPGILIVLPLARRAFYEAEEKPAELPEGRLLLLKGVSPARLMNFEGGPPFGSSSLKVIEINAIFNKGSRLGDMLQLPYCLSQEESHQCLDLCNQLIYRNALFRLGPDAPDISISLTLIELLRLLLSSSARAEESAGKLKQHQQRQKLKEYLISTLDQKITVPDMAKHLGLSRAYFSTHSQKLLGDTPSAFLRKIRLERSLELLINSEKTIDQITDEMGYSDRFYFSHAFKKHYGLTPSKARKQHRASGAKVSVQAQILFDSQQHEKALAVCDKALREKDQHLDLDAITYLKGQFLSILGNKEEAISTWNALKNGPYAYQAKLQQIQFLFDADRFDEATSFMDQLWIHGQRNQRVELIRIWLRHVRALRDQRRIRPLKNYLEIRRKHFVDDESSRMEAIYSCRRTGRYNDIPLHSRKDLGAHQRAYRGAAIYEKALELMSPKENANAYCKVLLDAGRFEEALTVSGGYAETKVEALIQLGKTQEAIQKFPDNCTSAHLENGDFAMALKTCKKGLVEHLCALIGLGRGEEFVAFESENKYHWFEAQLFLNPKKIIDSKIPLANEWRNDAFLLYAMELDLSKERTLELIEKFPSIHSDSFWIDDSYEPSILLRHVIPALLGKSDQLEKDLKAMIEDFPLIYRQTLLYDASYLLGEMDFEEWRRQPYQIYLKSRGDFIQGIKEDLRGDHKKARKHYLAIGQLKAPYVEGLLRRRFAEWRLRELA